MAGLFQILRGTADGGFETATPLTGTDGEPLLIPYEGQDEITKGICTKPWAADWDGDGDLDLLVGNFEGSFYLFSGEGKGKFSPTPSLVETESGPLRIEGAHSDPMMADWDGDGDLDILSGSSNGGAQWAENLSEDGENPTFSAFASLVPGSQYRPTGEIVKLEDLERPFMSTRVWTDDFNKDGKLDLMIGDSVTLVSPVDGLSEEDYLKKLAKWQEKSNALQRQESDPEKEKARNEKFRELYFARSEFMKEDSTGFVWVYFRK